MFACFLASPTPVCDGRVPARFHHHLHVRAAHLWLHHGRGHARLHQPAAAHHWPGFHDQGTCRTLQDTQGVCACVRVCVERGVVIFGGHFWSVGVITFANGCGHLVGGCGCLVAGCVQPG